MDITSTSFGLLIAYLLPGLVALFGLSYWIQELRDLFDAFLTGGSNIGLFLLVALASIATNLQVTLIRWAIFEEWICRRYSLKPEDFKDMSNEGKFSAFRGAVDEHYRYHQFWGCMAIALPILFIGWAQRHDIYNFFWNGFLITVLFLIVEGLTWSGAVKAYTNYVNRTRYIMKGG